MRAPVKITPGEKKSPRRVSPFLAWGDFIFNARSRFARSTIPEEKWGTTRSLLVCSSRAGKKGS